MMVLNAWKRVHHPNIIALRNCYLSNGAVFFVHDFYPTATSLYDCFLNVLALFLFRTFSPALLLSQKTFSGASPSSYSRLCRLSTPTISPVAPSTISTSSWPSKTDFGSAVSAWWTFSNRTAPIRISKPRISISWALCLSFSAAVAFLPTSKRWPFITATNSSMWYSFCSLHRFQHRLF